MNKFRQGAVEAYLRMDNTSPDAHCKSQYENYQSKELTCSMHPKHILAAGKSHEECSEWKEENYSKSHEDTVRRVNIVFQ